MTHRENKPDRKRLIGRHYEHRIDTARPSFEILDWASAQSQRARFEILANNVDLAGKSLLDVGCGLGDLLGYMQERSIAVQYTGVDILEKMVEAARARHKDGRFLVADLFRGDSPFAPGSFDVVFCSGAFNLNLGNNRQFLPAAFNTLLALARQTLAVNLLHSRSRTQEQTYFYYDPADIRRMHLCDDCHMRIIDDYLHNDFTVLCDKTISGGGKSR